MLRGLRISQGVFLALAIGCAAIAAAALATSISTAATVTGGFNERQWLFLAPWGRIGLGLAIATAVTAWLLAIISIRQIRSPWRWLIVFARTGAIAAAMAIFLQPAVELREVEREPNYVAVVVNSSSSMGLKDKLDSPERIELARRFIERSKAAFDSWSQSHIVEYFSFDSELSSIDPGKLDELSALGSASKIRAALEQTRQRYDQRDLAGIILISDGLSTDSLKGGVFEAADIDLLSSLDTRVHAVWTGESEVKDVALTDVLVDEFAFVRTVLRIEVNVRVSGYRQDRIPVVLSSEGRDLRRQWIEPTDGENAFKVTFEITPERVGKFAYSVSSPPRDDDVAPSNNRRDFVVRVVRDKFRVLHVAGQPSWDVRALRGILKQNPNIDLISFFILRTQADMPGAPPSELSLIPFPTRELFEEELPSFDLIVLQNFNFRPYGLAPYLDNIRDYVEAGGGLAVLGGKLSFSSGEYAGTPLAPLLPVKLEPESARDLVNESMFSVKLTSAGLDHPATRLRQERATNADAWSKLPPLQGINIVAGLADDAVVLAEHPRRKSRDGRAAPVLAVREAGKGRVLAVMTDTLWHWGFVAAADGDGHGHDYEELWENAMRWLISDPELQLLRISTEQMRYEPKEDIVINIRLRGPDYSPLSADVDLELLPSSTGENAVVVKQSVRTDEAGHARITFPALEPGIYRAQGTSNVGERVERADDVFSVRESTAELDRSAADGTTLAAIANATGGTLMSAADRVPADLPLKEPRVSRVDRSRDVELWSGPWLLLLCLALLAVEWGLRQHSGYR